MESNTQLQQNPILDGKNWEDQTPPFPPEVTQHLDLLDRDGEILLQPQNAENGLEDEFYQKDDEDHVITFRDQPPILVPPEGLAPPEEPFRHYNLRQ